MRPPGTFKLLGRTRRPGFGACGPHAAIATRSDRIVDSLRTQILETTEDQSLRIRQIFEEPKEIFRIEIEQPEYAYQRTTLLDRDALEDLLATDDVRERFVSSASRHERHERHENARRAPEGGAGRERRLVPGAGLEPARP
ncbi:MAG: hypothetical protein IPK00_00090 [Deltaproteobacteria bacterium]|nr:hypothetical protein [Deltaproteobacteria bacterium]